LIHRGVIESLWRNAAQPSERFPVGDLGQEQHADGVALSVDHISRALVLNNDVECTRSLRRRQGRVRHRPTSLQRHPPFDVYLVHKKGR
jgi:hypothetical protein